MVKANKPLLILYSRSYCHLCHDMLAALEAWRDEVGAVFEIQVLDVDADPLLVERYDELVPVLLGAAHGRELCHYHLDLAAVRAYLGEFR